MKICFNFDNLTLRGTTTAIIDYAFYNEKILGNKSIISYPKDRLNESYDSNYSKRFEIVEQLKKSYEVIEYAGIDQLEKTLNSIQCDHIYFLKAGFKDHYYIPGKQNLIHCVFNHYDPHGEKYAYVSEWLGEENKSPYVPHIVKLPDYQKTDLRKLLNISEERIVVGRYGGFDQFDFDFVKNTVAFIAQNDPNFIFVFVNTRKFIEHPNVFFLDPILLPQEKTDFIKSCDLMLHARSDGESFGLSICEFLYHNKPVFTCGLGRDKNNIKLLEKSGSVYHNQYELIDLLFKYKYDINFKENYQRFGSYKQIVDQFSPEEVMKKFNEVFLCG